MIRVGMVTTLSTQQRCGIAEYSRMLREHLPKDIEVTEIGGPYDVKRLLPRVVAGGFDIVHFQYESGFLGIFSPGVARQFGKRTVLTLHDHFPRENRRHYPFVNEMDRVVVHQDTQEGLTHIPHGIEVLEGSDRGVVFVQVGTAGFPLGHKGVLLVAEAAQILSQERKLYSKWGCRMICPESPHVDTHKVEQEVKRIFPEAEYYVAWWPQREVMRLLSQNMINVFPYRNGKPGISAAVRLGLGTGTRMVLTKSTMFMDLWDSERYRDEIEWVEGDPDQVTSREIADACNRVIENAKRPKKILEDMAWPRVANQYADLYRELAA